MAETKRQENSKRDKYDKHETMDKSLDPRQLLGFNSDENLQLREIDRMLNRRDILVGGWSVLSVTPVLGSSVEKVDDDEPMVSMVSTTGFMVLLYKPE